MKTKFIAAGKRGFTFSLWPVLAFGYYSQIAWYDKYHAQQYQTWYFLCFKLSATQYFRAFNKDID